jgi:hypothetical protein
MVFAQVFPGFQGFRPLVLKANGTLDANLIGAADQKWTTIVCEPDHRAFY